MFVLVWFNCTKWCGRVPARGLSEDVRMAKAVRRVLSEDVRIAKTVRRVLSEDVRMAKAVRRVLSEDVCLSLVQPYHKVW
jgi:hypothetical protein